MHPKEQLFTIQQLSLKLKIPKPTLRFWEKELDGILVPLRTPGGQRRYTSRHIAIIEQTKKLRKKGMGLCEIREKLRNGDSEDTLHSDTIELFANRVADIVRAEVYEFFKREYR